MASGRQNTPGLGIEYEVHLPAYFALLLNSNPEIKDFTLRSNVEEFGNLDDLLVDIKTKSGENLYFAFQLKHKENSNKNLLPTNFEAKGDFNLEKYCEAFKKLSEENKKYHFILYTNKNFDASRTNDVKKFDMRQDECCLGRNFFNTSGDGKHLYKFEVNEETEDGKNVNKEDYREFLSRFSLYTGQANIRDLDKSHILDILKHRECYVTYIDFFRRWHRGDFIDKIIDKKTLNVHLVDILLSSVAINYHLSDGQDGNSNFFEAMVQQFDITIIDASKQDFIKQLKENVFKYPEEFNNLDEIIKLGKKSKLIDRFTKELNEKTKHKLLHYFFHKPLILDFHKSSEDLFYEASKLCKIQENGIKLVILGQDIDISKFSHLKIFTNLTQVHGSFLEEAKRRCNLYLQGRKFSFEEIFEDEIRQFVTPKDIFQMLKGSFSIGEDKENLPQCYIPRTVSAALFNPETIIRNSSSSSVFIFYCKNEFENFKISIERIMRHQGHLYEYFLNQTTIILRKKERTKRQLQEDYQNVRALLPTIVVSKTEYTKMQLIELLQELRKGKNHEEIEKEDLHIFKAIDGKGFLLLMSTNNISYNKNLIYRKISVKEDNIHVVFNSSINILCAQPGMGKSTLMKYLRNECEPGFWALRVDLKAHNQFLMINHTIGEILKHFFQLENCRDLLLLSIANMFIRRKKIVLFLDGLDEVENECVDRVLHFTRQLSEMGFRIWLSSRQNLQQKIEHYFNILAIEIDKLSENQQKNYIEDRLRSSYDKNEIEEIVDIIFTNTDLVNNRQILEIPLQLHVITQIFLDDKSYYSNLRQNNFIFTKMFEIFFEGKYKHYLAKIKSENPHLLGALKEKLKDYEIIALHSVLDDEHFQKLQIENFKLSHVSNWDFLGIITEVNSENKAVFEHLTFAEYFASKFLVKNFDKARILKEEIFSEKYQNLRIILNTMLVEDSPLHLAIVYKDLSRIEELEQSSLVDKGGRNFLQVAACVATRHPPLESEAEVLFRNTSWFVKKFAPTMFTKCVVKDKSVQQFKGEDPKIRNIVKRVLPSESLKNDKIFEWNSLDYALVNGALYIVEAILEKFDKSPNFYEILSKYYSDEVVAYYSIRFGYHRLLSEIIVKNTCHVTGILSDHFRWKSGHNQDISILHFLFVPWDCRNAIKIIELLTGDDINKIIHEEKGYTFLHLAVFQKDIDVLKFLLEKRADVNVKDKKGQSPLFVSVDQNNFQITRLLVEKGADVNIKDKKYGRSPLSLAVEESNFKIVKYLLEKGADVNITNKRDGRSPLFSAVSCGNFEISKLLVEKGANVNIKDREDAHTPLFIAVFRNNFEITKLLVEKGANINIKDREGEYTPLSSAVSEENYKITKFLLEQGADANIKVKNNKMWPLFSAILKNNFEISKLLVENGADLNIRDEDGRSPLSLAVQENNNFEISKLLIEKGADVQGSSILFWAAYQQNYEISKLLVENGADGSSALFQAVEQNNFEISKLLIEKGTDVNNNTYREDGKTPLFLAVEKNNLEISKFLIEKGADVNIKDKENGWSPLFFTVCQNKFRIAGLVVDSKAEQNNFEITKLLVEKGADVNIKDKNDGRSPLYLAIEEGNLEIAKYLLEKGADVNTINKRNGRSLLFISAICRNNFEISKLLVEKGSDANIRDKEEGIAPLIWAICFCDFDLVKLLIENGDVNIKDRNGKSPLLWAVEEKKLEISKLLVEKGADVNIRNKEDERTPLFLAVFQENFELSKLLVEKGADVNINDKKEARAPLFWAVYRDNFEISKLLIEKGADVNIKDKQWGKTLLFFAIKRNNNFEISKLLVENGSNVNIRDDEHGRTALFWAIKRNNFDISKLLVKNGADLNIRDKKNGRSPLLLAVKQDKSKISELLIKEGANVNIKDKYGVSPLLLAVKQSNFKISKLLVEKGADVNVKDKDDRMPLFLALERDNLEISKLLIEKGANVNIKNENNWSPLLLTVTQNKVEISKLLVEKGAHVNGTDNYGRSPLYWAVYLNDFEISKLLIEKGADVNIKGKDHGSSPLYWAVKQNNQEIAKLLFKNGAKVNSEIRDAFYAFCNYRAWDNLLERYLE